MTQNFFVAIVFGAIVMLPACSFADDLEPLKKAEPPVWSIGDIRTYRISSGGKDFIQKETVTAVSNEGYTVAIEKTDGAKTTELYSPELMLIKTMNSSGKVVEKYDSGVTIIKWPLKAGDSWSVDHMAHNPKLGSLLMTIDAVVTAETVMTDGKEIATLKIFAKRKNRSRVYIDQLERWYDPSSKCFIRSALTRLLGDPGAASYVKELVSFTPGQAK